MIFHTWEQRDTPQYIRGAANRRFFKIVVLKYFAIFTNVLQYSQEITCIGVSGLQIYSKETPAQIFSCKYCEVLKNTIFHRTPAMAASEIKSMVLIVHFLHMSEFTFKLKITYFHVTAIICYFYQCGFTI